MLRKCYGCEIFQEFNRWNKTDKEELVYKKLSEWINSLPSIMKSEELMRIFTDSFRSHIKKYWKINNFDTEILKKKDWNFVEILDNKNMNCNSMPFHVKKIFPVINKKQH